MRLIANPVPEQDTHLVVVCAYACYLEYDGARLSLQSVVVCLTSL